MQQAQSVQIHHERGERHATVLCIDKHLEPKYIYIYMCIYIYIFVEGRRPAGRSRVRSWDGADLNEAVALCR